MEVVIVQRRYTWRMANEKSLFLDRIEWGDPCRDRFQIEGEFDRANLPPGTRTITLFRDEHYRVSAEIGGRVVDVSAYRAYAEEHAQIPKGTVRRAGVDISVSDRISETALQTSEGGRSSLSYLADANAWAWTEQREVYRYTQRYFQTTPPRNGPAWWTDWYLNGPREFVLGSATQHERRTTFSRQRAGQPLANFAGDVQRSTSRDHVRVTAGDLSFIVHEVPKDLGPAWSQSLGIEYGGTSAVPDEPTRRAVEEIVSFVLGRRLLRVGATGYDVAGFPVEEEAVNPWGDNVHSLCAQYDDSPFPIQINVEGSLDTAALLRDLVPGYLARRDTLKLHDALWWYWLAKEAPLGIDLLLFSAGVESLKAAWFRSMHSKSRGTYMDKKAFCGLLGETLAAAKEKLAGHPFAERILDRMGRAFQMGANEQVEGFFREIALDVGMKERAAMHARNLPAHGGTVVSDEEMLALVRHALAYKVLFERVFLRLIDYSGVYVDRSTVGFPHRLVSQPPGD